MKFHIITIFPKMLDSYIHESILKRAQEEKLIEINMYDLRDWTNDKHRTVDDSPYGGGAGMVMKIEPLYQALMDVKKKAPNAKVVLLSPRGRTWNQQLVKEYSQVDEIILICGRYEGVDERLLNYIDEQISIGDYVLTGGELGAAVMIDSLSRLVPGVLGNNESSVEESHSTPGQLEYPQYTRPEVFTDSDGQVCKVPDVLMSGNHKEIETWRKKQMKKKK